MLHDQESQEKTTTMVTDITAFAGSLMIFFFKLISSIYFIMIIFCWIFIIMITIGDIDNRSFKRLY